ncbi:hypothetical protein Q8G38_16115 [Halomonas venusta]|nr:hypothetical protein [Halomonas venusta]MDW0360839.1 hypothetical protein [Halomonas venusta]
MSDTTRWVLALGLFAAFAAVGLWLCLSIWDECREAGHGALYCMRMVTR